MMTFRQRLSTALALCVLNAAPLSGQAQQSELLPLPLDEVRMFTEALDRIRMAYVEEIDDNGDVQTWAVTKPGPYGGG